MKFNHKKSWFTLIELIVSITILWIIMSSIFAIFQLSASLNSKIDISRSMQENSKNIIELISEDIKTNTLSWINNDILNPNCSLSSIEYYTTWTKLCIWNNSYFLAKFDNVLKIYTRTDESYCDWKNECVIVKQNLLDWIVPISNTWVNFRYLRFYVSGWNEKEQKKVTITYEMLPSKKKGIPTSIVNDYKINFQTTLTQNIYKLK